MTPEEARRALLAGEPVDWAEIDNMTFSDDELTEADDTLNALFATALPAGWEQQVLHPPPATKHERFLDRVLRAIDNARETLTGVAWPSALTPATVRSEQGDAQRAEASVLIDAGTQFATEPFWVDVSVVGAEGRLIVDVGGVPDTEIGTALRLGLDGDPPIIVEPTGVAPGYVSFELDWAGDLPEDLVLYLVQAT